MISLVNVTKSNMAILDSKKKQPSTILERIHSYGAGNMKELYRRVHSSKDEYAAEIERRIWVRESNERVKDQYLEYKKELEAQKEQQTKTEEEKDIEDETSVESKEDHLEHLIESERDKEDK